MEVIQEPIKIYARVNTNHYVTQFIETAHSKGEILETDIFIEEGYGDDYAYPHARKDKPLIALDYQSCHNFMIADGALKETTPEKKAEELAARPKPEPSADVIQAETNMDFDYRLSMIELGL